jgi:hypothetical protein
MPENIDEERDLTLSEKLYGSSAVSSLNLETKVFDRFKELEWVVKHSPYYLDVQTNKFREIDITARKYWRSGDSIDLSCSVNFVVECKTLKDYHIVVSNRLEHKVGNNLIPCWVGQDTYTHYSRTIELLRKHNVNDKKSKYVLRELNKFCYPDVTFRFYDYKLNSFDIPIFNSFRETNIGTTKELDNSVVWKSFQSLYSCIEAYKEFVWDGIDYHLYDVERDEFVDEEEKAEELLRFLILKARHMSYVHPLLVIESDLWEVTGRGLKKLKYLRLIFQQMFEGETWIDVVNKNYLEEYLKKTEQYDAFLTKKGFKFK